MIKIKDQIRLDNEEKSRMILKRYQKALEIRHQHEDHWQECCHFTFPERHHDGLKKPSKRSHLFDATAPDAVEQLAASLLAELTPAWTAWFDLQPGCDAQTEDQTSGTSAKDTNAEYQLLAKTTKKLQRYFERSNFLIEIHQCYLDLAMIGTACLLFEEMPAGHGCPFHFTCVSMHELAFEEDERGQIDTVFRKRSFDSEHFQRLFPSVSGFQRDDEKVTIIEAILPRSDGQYDYCILHQDKKNNQASIIKSYLYRQNPFLVFRWTKSPGSFYGTSPVMKTLPDIKTANKVVELILKNATIAVTGIWQADDDGVINPANIKLLPGTIIPKAVGSTGLTPLKSPGNFDISQLILKDLREHIRHGLLTDKLGQTGSFNMTATEVLERSAEMNRLLGAVYGRLQVELLAPLVRRAIAILVRRGEIDPIHLDGRAVSLRYLSPLSRFHKDQEASALLQKIDWLRRIFPEIPLLKEKNDVILKLADKLDLPLELFDFSAQAEKIPSA